MKKSIIIQAVLFCMITAAAAGQTAAQKIRIASKGHVIIRQGEPVTVKGEEGEDVSSKYNITSDGWININASESDEIIITCPSVEKIVISGSGKVETDGVIKADDLELVVSGIGKIELNLEANRVQCDISGAGKIELVGKANDLEVNISGAGKVEGGQFKVKNCEANISGSGKCMIDVTDNLTSNISGTGSVFYVNPPANIKSNNSGVAKVMQADSSYTDTTRISLGNKQILIIEPGDEATDLLKLDHSDKLKSHWAGFELGVNMLMNTDFSTDPPTGYDYLEPRIEKSIAVNFNLVDLELDLSPDKRVMVVTGLGYTINNYRFKSDAFFVPDADEFSATYDSTEYKKNKLVIHYLTVPLLFEFNTSTNPRKTFHFAAGVIGGLRLASHQKLVKETGSKDYKVKTYDDFNLNPLRADATVRMGYGNFTVFGSYSLTSLFKDGKGPELYPLTAGIRFVGW